MLKIAIGLGVAWVISFAIIVVLSIQKSRRRRKIERLKMVVNFQDTPEEW